MQLKQISCFSVISPCYGLQAICGRVSLGIAVKRSINTRHIYQLAICAINIIGKGLLAYDHVVQCRKDLIRPKLASESYRHL